MGACLPSRQNRNRFLDQKVWQKVVWMVWLVPDLFLDQEKTLSTMAVAGVVVLMVMAAWWVVLLSLQFSPVPWPVFAGLFAGVEMVIFFQVVVLVLVLVRSELRVPSQVVSAS